MENVYVVVALYDHALEVRGPYNKYLRDKDVGILGDTGGSLLKSFEVPRDISDRIWVEAFNFVRKHNNGEKLELKVLEKRIEELVNEHMKMHSAINP